MPARTRSGDEVTMAERILRVADTLFYRQGLQAVGVDLIAAEAGISKRTLYNYFPSKDELIAAYLARRTAPLAEPGPSPATDILEFFDRLGESFAADGFRGCPFINVVAEFGAPGHPAHAIAREAKARRLRWFRERLDMLAAPDPTLLASQLAILADGAITQALVRGETGAAQAAREAARVLLRHAGISTPSGGRADRRSSAAPGRRRARPR